jgi:hypothetical protein
MPILEFVLAIGIGLLSFLFLSNNISQKKILQRLDEAFYQLLESENGYITLIQLATTARVDAELTRAYLEHQAKAFAATLEVDADGDYFYRFPKLHQGNK